MASEGKIREMMNRRMAAIAAAAQRGDLAIVSRLSKEATELEALLKTATGISTRLAELENESVDAAPPDAPSFSPETNLRLLAIEITQGMINQNLLTMTPHVKKKVITVGEYLFIETDPDGDRFKTDLLENGKKLRERGAIGRFYSRASVRAGDFVELIEREPKQWLLRKAEPGKYKSSKRWAPEDFSRDFE